MRCATSFGWDIYIAWLLPFTSVTWLFARLYIHRSRSGLMARSPPATIAQLGLLRQAGVVMGVSNAAAAVSTWDCAMNWALAFGRSAQKSAANTAGSRYR